MSAEEKRQIEYLNYVETMLSKHFRESMLMLMDMGFTDYRKNERLLEKFKGNLEAVTNELAMS